MFKEKERWNLNFGKTFDYNWDYYKEHVPLSVINTALLLYLLLLLLLRYYS